MKKLFKMILSTLFAFGMCCGLAGCAINIFNSSSTSEEHEHMGQWLASEQTHYWQYTCGCPSPDIAELHFDRNNDNICDLCKYSFDFSSGTGDGETPHVHEYKQTPTEDTICGLATCEEPAKYYCVCDCGLVDTTATFYFGEPLPHEPREYYGYDENEHYEICDVCDTKIESKPHAFEEGFCTVCKHTEGESLGLYFTKTEDETGYLVIGYGRFEGDTLVIPRYHKGLPVVGMTRTALAWPKVKTVKIHGGIKEICEKAFYACSNIETLILEEGIESIGEDAFWGCGGLKELNLPSSVKTIGKGAFCSANSLKSLVIPEGVTYIGQSAFIGSEHLLHVTLPSTLQTIEESAFRGCPKLLEIKNLSALELKAGEKSVFGNICENAKRIYKDGDNNFYINDAGFIFYRGDENILVDCLREYEDLVLPDDCKGEPYYIGKYAFYLQKWIKTVTFGAQVTMVGEDAFSNCTSLEKVTFSPSVKTLESGAFYYTLALEEINFVEGLERIEASAFYRAEKVKELHFPASLNYVWQSFGEMNGLEKITAADGGTFYAEGNCLIYKGGHLEEKSLVLGCKNSVIPNGKVETIERRAFNLSSLTTLKIPESVQEIEPGAFSECPATVLENGVWYVDNWCIGFAENQTEAVIKEGTVGLAQIEGWYLESSVCKNLDGIETLTLPNSLQKISSGFFYDWDGEIVWGDAPTLTRIGRSDFSGYMGTTLTIPNSVKVIEAYAFSACYGLQEIIVPEGVTEIQESAFYYCINLKKMHLPSTLVSFAEGHYAVQLEEITVAKGNEQYKAINGCLVEIASKKAMLLTQNGTLPDDGSVEILTIQLLNNRTETELVIPEGVKEIEGFAIYQCKNVTAIYLPKSIKILLHNWWCYCDNLTDIYYAGTQEEWAALRVEGGIGSSITVHFLGETS